MRERALREEDRVERRADDCRGGDTRVRDALGEAEDSRERERGDQEHPSARDRDAEAEEFPREREVGHDERRVRVRERGVRDELAVGVDVARGGDEVAGLVPVVGEVYERQVEQEEGGEDEE